MRTVVIIEPHPLFRLGLRQLLCEALPQVSVRDYDPTVLDETDSRETQTCDILLLTVNDSQTAIQLAEAADTQFKPRSMLLLGEEHHLPPPNADLPHSVAGVVTLQACTEVLKASVTLVAAGGTCFPCRWNPEASQRTVGTVEAAPMGEPSTRYQPTHWPAPRATGATVMDAAPPRMQCSQSVENPDVEFNTPIKPGSAAHKESQLLGLTPRQYEVLVLLARGYPMKKVGRALNISVATAKAHTETLYQRLDVHNRNAAVYAAVTRGATLGWARKLAAEQRAGSN